MLVQVSRRVTNKKIKMNMAETINNAIMQLWIELESSMYADQKTVNLLACVGRYL